MLLQLSLPHNASRRYRISLRGIIPLLIILSVTITTDSSHAQTSHLRFQHLNVEQGLSQSRVSAITQDRRGFLWIGTEDGLSRFDGYQFAVYREDKQNPRSFSGGTIHSLYADAAGPIWIGTEKGLNRYDPATNSFTRYLHGDKLSDRIYSICADRSGQFWLGTDTGLSRFDPATGRFTRFRHDPARADSPGFEQVNSLLEDSRGRFWIVGQNSSGSSALDLLDRQEGTFTHFTEKDGVPGEFFSLLEDDAGYLWFSHTEGLWRFDPSTRTSRFFVARGLLQNMNQACSSETQGESFTWAGRMV